MENLLKPAVSSANKISVRWWKNADGKDIPANGTLFFLHGIGEHSARYNEFASYISQWGFDFLSFDHPGYGLTARDGAYKQHATFTDMVAEAHDVLRYWFEEGPYAKNDLTKAPIFFMGHSMGGLLLLTWMTRNKPLDEKLRPAKMVVSSPAVGLRLKVPQWKEMIATALHTLAPNLALGNEISPDFLSNDRVCSYAFESDPLRSSAASPKLYISLKAAMEEVKKDFLNVKIPALCFVGSDDPIVDPQAFKEYVEKIKAPKKFVEYQGMRHECLNEMGREKVFSEVLRWLLA